MNMDTTIAKADSLDGLAVEIIVEHEAALKAVRSGLEHARRAGELLIEAKAAQEHGAWLPWLAEHCPAISERVAQMYMRVAQRWPELEAAANAKHVSHLPLRAALLMLAEPRQAMPADDDFERDVERARADLAVLDRARKAPDVSVEELVAIVRQAEAIENDFFARGITTLAAMGHLIENVKRDFGPKLAELIAESPAAVLQAADARIAELTERAS